MSVSVGGWARRLRAVSAERGREAAPAARAQRPAQPRRPRRPARAAPRRQHAAPALGPRAGVGQNLAWSSRWDLERLVRLWFEEVNLFNASAVGAYAFEPATGHYTQLVWAQTRLVGCARADRGPARPLRFSLVCNYGPAGNVLRRPVYLGGRPRSACPPRTLPDQEYLGLCASPTADFTPMRLHPSLRAPPAPRPPNPPGAPAKTAPGGGHKQKQERTQKTRKFAKEKAPKQQRVLVTTSKYDVSTSSGAAIGEKMATYDIQSLTVLVLKMLSAYLISSFELRF